MGNLFSRSYNNNCLKTQVNSLPTPGVTTQTGLNNLFNVCKLVQTQEGFTAGSGNWLILLIAIILIIFIVWAVMKNPKFY